MSLLFLMSAIFAVAQELDIRFVSLMEWASELSTKGKFWNETCTADQTKAGCKEFLLVLNDQYTMFAEAALRYTQNDDTCAGALRVKIVKHQVAIALHNIECAGNETTTQCAKERGAIKTDADKLKKEMDACSPTDQKL